jgi:hypothetical protein
MAKCFGLELSVSLFNRVQYLTGVLASAAQEKPSSAFLLVGNEPSLWKSGRVGYAAMC